MALVLPWVERKTLVSKAERPDLRGKALVPDVPYQAHSASLTMAFYAASSGKSAFPASFVGDALVAFHGSWNRSLRNGLQAGARSHEERSAERGDYEDFLTGFIADERQTSGGGRVATTQLKDGSLLLSDDGRQCHIPHFVCTLSTRSTRYVCRATASARSPAPVRSHRCDSDCRPCMRAV